MGHWIVFLVSGVCCSLSFYLSLLACLEIPGIRRAELGKPMVHNLLSKNEMNGGSSGT